MNTPQDEFGVMLLSTIALLDVAKGKLHPVVDAINVLNFTEEDVFQLTGARQPSAQLARMRQKALQELKEVPQLLHSIAETLESCIEALEESLETEPERAKP